MKKCVLTISDGTLCSQVVSGGGDRHARGYCRVPPHGEHRRHMLLARKRRRKDSRENEAMGINQRGVSVAGIHKVSASSKESNKKKVPATTA